MTEQKTIAESPPQPSRVEEAKSMAEEMVEVYKFLSTSKKVWEGMVDGKPVSYSLPPDLLIQSAIASIGIVNKDRRMDEQNNKVENADKAAFAAGKYRICPKCKGEVPERVSSRTGSTFYRCNPCGVFVDDTPDSRPPKTTPGTQQKPQEPPKGSAGKAFQSAEGFAPGAARQCPDCDEMVYPRKSKTTGKTWYGCDKCKQFVNEDGETVSYTR